MFTKNYQTQCLLVIHKKTFLNAEPVTPAKKTLLCLMFLYSAFLVITLFT